MATKPSVTTRVKGEISRETEGKSSAPDLRALALPELRALRDHVRARLGEINERLANLGAPPEESVIVDRLTLARLIGVGPDRVSVYTREGMPVLIAGRRGSAGRYDAVPALAWWRVKKQGSADAEKARKDRSIADLNELSLARRREELVPIVAVRLDWAAYIVPCKTRLRGLPSRAKQRLPHLTGKDLSVLTEIVDEALNELAEET